MEEVALYDLINEGWERMTLAQRRLWEAINIPPEKWAYQRLRYSTVDHWVVAIIGNRIIWYDDDFGGMDKGFYVLEYRRYGEIDSGRTGNGSLEAAVQILLHEITGLGFGQPDYSSGSAVNISG